MEFSNIGFLDLKLNQKFQSRFIEDLALNGVS